MVAEQRPSAAFFRFRAIGLAGPLTLFVGLFCPAYLGDFFPSLYLSSGRPNVLLVFLLALYSIVLVLTLRRWSVLVFGGLAAGLVLFDYDHALTTHSSQLGFRESFLSSSVGWGWVVMIIGSALVILAPAFYDRTWVDRPRIARAREWCAVIATTVFLVVAVIYGIVASDRGTLWAIVLLGLELISLYREVAFQDPAPAVIPTGSLPSHAEPAAQD